MPHFYFAPITCCLASFHALLYNLVCSHNSRELALQCSSFCFAIMHVCYVYLLLNLCYISCQIQVQISAILVSFPPLVTQPSHTHACNTIVKPQKYGRNVQGILDGFGRLNVLLTTPIYQDMTRFRGVGRGRALRGRAPLPQQQEPHLLSVCATFEPGHRATIVLLVYIDSLVADHQHAQELASNLILQCSTTVKLFSSSYIHNWRGCGLRSIDYSLHMRTVHWFALCTFYSSPPPS